MKRILKLLVVVIVFIFTLTGCINRNKTSEFRFTEPDIIMVYKNNSTESISKDNKLYSVILGEMIKRFDKDALVTKLTLDGNKMKTTKQNELVVEFIYFSNQKLVDSLFEKEYSSLIFPLTGENKQLCFFEESKNYYSNPIGRLNKSNVLL